MKTSAHHVSQRAGVDVGVMDAAVFSVSIFPVGRTLVMFAEPLSFFCISDGAAHTDQTGSDQVRLGQSNSDQVKSFQTS